MTLRLLRRTVFIAGLGLLAALPSTSQGRRSPRVHGARAGRSGSSRISPETLASIAKAAAVTLPWFDNIENGTAGWTATGFWHTPYRPQQISVLSPTINPDLVTLPDDGHLPSPYSGNYCWWYGENSTGTFIGKFTLPQSLLSGGTSDSANSGDLITPPISLAGVDSSLLSFWTWWEIEGVEANAFDLMNVDASSDGGLNWNTLGRGELNPLNNPSGASYKPYTSNGLGQRGSWTQQLFDLRTYAGKTILIRFRFDTGDAQFNGFRGWFIDDIGVTAGAVGSPFIGQVTPPVVNPTLTRVMDVTGYNFVNGATILVDGSQVSGGVLSASLAQFDPTGLAAGVHSVTITNPDGKSFTWSGQFVVTSATPPLFSSVQPDSSPVGIGVPLTITGNHFKQGVSVSIGGVSLPGPKLVDSTTIQVVAPSTLPIGIYNIIVSNADQLSDIGILSFRITPFVYAVGDSQPGKAQTLQLAPVSSLYDSGKVFYRMAGKIPYDSLALTGSAGHFSATLPASVITIRGAEYYFRLVSLQGISLTYPGINPSLSPAILPVRVQRVIPPNPPVATKYRMISSPMVLDNPFVMGQLGDDYGAYNPAKWRVFKWVRNGYHELVPYVGLTLDPGDAVWAVTATGAPFSLKRGVSVPSDQQFSVPIDTGWNQIADPFAFNVAWAGVSGSQFVMGPYFYDGVQYRLVTTTLAPYEGYFVYNPGNAEPATHLYFFPVEDTSSVLLHKESGPAAALKPGEFVLQLSGAIPGTEYRDTYNYVGFRAGATAGRDRFDAPKPPPIGSGLQVNIVDGGALYLENYKPAGDQGASWVIGVSAAGTTGKSVLTLASFGTLPVGYTLHVLDLANENAVPGMPGAFEVGLDAPNTPRYFKVIIGTDDFASKESQGIPLRPVAYALEQNYPNPFNPSTMIRYSLAKKSDVVLEIFNTLGQRVRTLANGVQSTGEYAVTWDGTNDSGGHIASGVYFCRLRTGEFTAVRKLAMIR